MYRLQGVGLAGSEICPTLATLSSCGTILTAYTYIVSIPLFVEALHHAHGTVALVRQHLGDTIIVTGVIHLVASPIFYRNALTDLVREGLIGSLTDMTRYEHLEAYWYIASGLMMIGIGLLTRAHLRATGTLPASFGWLMLVSTTFLSLMMPVTGMWELRPRP